jgi:3-oxoacyl-[acyl-carrier-protein] synthase II
MKLASMGLVFAGGAGLARLQAALQAGRPPQPRMLEREQIPVLAVPPDALTCNPVLAPARRADRFCKMAMLAGMEAWQGCRAAPARTGLILASALGPHATVFRYVSEMLDFGGEKASPTLFSQSVHAAAASMIATAAGLHGPVLSLADLAAPVEEALGLADAWLEGDRCDTVLVAAVDELSDVLAHVVRRKWQGTVPGEGAVCFRLEREGSPRVAMDTAARPDAACHLLDTGALGEPVVALDAGAIPGVPAFSLTPYWGSLRIGAAFHLAAAALICREPHALAAATPGAASRDATTAATAARRGGAVQILSSRGRRVITLQGEENVEERVCQ